MQYVNGHDISTQSINDVQSLALTKRIPWAILEKESDQFATISGYTSQERGVYLNKGVSEFNISPENMYELLYNISLRPKWDLYCTEAQVLEEYDHLNHIVAMSITHPLGTIKMVLYRSCKYDPQHRLYVIAMRSIELEDKESDDCFECLPNGWVIQGIDGHKDKCRLIFVQQCHLRDIELQKIPGFRSFQTRETLGDFHFLTIFPASVSGRLGKIYEALRNFISNNSNQIQIIDTRLKILEQAEREVNEMFGTSSPEYGWQSYLKKYDMEILVKKINGIYYMVAKGSFSSLYTPSQIADLLYCEKPWGWDTFYENGRVVENITESAREIEMDYRMWHETFSTRLLQSIKKGPGNCSAIHWRAISTSDFVNENDMEVSFLPSGLFNYGLGEGSFTTFLVVCEVKGAKTPQEEELVTKLFGARVISTQNHIINVMNQATRATSQGDVCLPVIPTLDHHSQLEGYSVVDQSRGVPSAFYNMVENFANLLLSDSIAVNQKKAHRPAEESEKSKRKRNFADENEEEGEENRIFANDDQQQELYRQHQLQLEIHQQQEEYKKRQELESQNIDKKEHIQRPTIRITTNIISNKQTCNDGLIPKPWNESKKQPFLFLVSDSANENNTKRLRRRDYSLSNSLFDSLPEEIVQYIFSALPAADVLNTSMVCKRFKVATDNSGLWKHLYLVNPIFNKSIPKRSHPIQQQNILNGADNSSSGSTAPVTSGTNNINEKIMATIGSLMNNFPGAGAGINIDLNQISSLLSNPTMAEGILTLLNNLQNQTPQQIQQQMEQFMSLMAVMKPDGQQQNQEDSDEREKTCGCSKQCQCTCTNGCNCECLNEELIGVSNWRSQYLHRLRLEDRWSKAQPKRITELKGHTKTIRCLKSEGSSAVSVSTDKKVRFWNLNSGQCIGTYEDNSTTVVSIGYDRSTKSSVIWPLTEYTKVHIGHKNGTVTLVDFMQRPHQVVSTLRPVLLADGFDFTSPGRFIVWESNIVECWEEEKQARLWSSNEHTKKINQAKLINSSLFANGIVCTASSDKTVKIRNVMDGSLISSLGGYSHSVNCLEPVGDYMFVTGSSDRLIKIWDLRKLDQPLISMCGHSSAVKAVAYEERGGHILSGGDDGVVVIWELNGWGKGHRECLGVSPPQQPSEQQNLVIGTCRESGRLTKHKSGITCIDVDEAGLTSSSQDGVIYRWDFT